jgi:hypothetical protein
MSSRTARPANATSRRSITAASTHPSAMSPCPFAVATGHTRGRTQDNEAVPREPKKKRGHKGKFSGPKLDMLMDAFPDFQKARENVKSRFDKSAVRNFNKYFLAEWVARWGLQLNPHCDIDAANNTVTEDEARAEVKVEDKDEDEVEDEDEDGEDSEDGGGEDKDDNDDEEDEDEEQEDNRNKHGDSKEDGDSDEDEQAGGAMIDKEIIEVDRRGNVVHDDRWKRANLTRVFVILRYHMPSLLTFPRVRS